MVVSCSSFPCDSQAKVLALHDSVILSCLDATRQAHFQDAMQGWLPGHTSTLLYRGTQDGFSPKGCHLCCDGKGATVTLIQSSNGCTFGGYSSVSWVSQQVGTARGVWLPSPGAFLFSVQGPRTSSFGPVRFPLKDEATKQAVCGWSFRGPIFGGYDLMLQSRGGTYDPFDDSCFSQLGSQYDDSHGPHPLTGGRTFKPIEVEVFAVKPL